MQYTSKKLPKSILEISLIIPPEEMEKYIPTTVEELGKEVKIEGFRPGKVPYEILKSKIGEMKIYEHAAEHAIWQCYEEILNKEKIQPIGSPHFEIQKIAPHNPVEVKISIPIFPKVIKLADWKKIKIEAKKTKISDEEVTETLSEIRKMQTKETVVNREAKKEDKIVIDIEMFLDGVPIEGGQAKNHSIYLNEPYYIPGFNEQLLGLKKDDVKIFKLPFPREHYQKNLAGKEVEFKIKVKEVFELSLPEIDEEFAKKLGQKNLEDLKNLIKKNLEIEAEMKEGERQEIAILNEIIKNSEIEDIPEILINREIEKMLAEYKYEINKNGLNFDDYLKSIKKSIGELKLDFVPKAIERLKAALVIREFIEQEKIEISDEEVMKEIEKQLNMYKDDPETQKEIRKPEYVEYLRNFLKNKKALEFLRKQCIK
jgi:trigger factor